MSSGIFTGGFLSPIGTVAPVAGASGVNIPFELLDTDGEPAESVDLSSAGVVRVSADGGDTWANRVGDAPVEGEDGVYRYTADNTEVAAAETTGFLLVKVKKTGYRLVVERADVNDSQLAAAVLEITNTVTAGFSTVGGDVVASTSAINAHTDSEVGTLQTNLENYADTKATEIEAAIDDAVTAINAETDAQSTVVQAAITAAIAAIDGHTDTVVAAAQTAINAHTDTTVTAAVTTLQAMLDLLAGLHRNNSVTDGGAGFDEIQYNGARLMTSARVRQFADQNAASLATPGADDNADGEIHRFLITGTDTGLGTLAVMTITQDL